MTKKSVIFAAGFVLLCVVAFAFNNQMNSTVLSSTQSSLPETPDYIVYRHLFRHAAAFIAQADELERQGRDAAHLRGFFKRKAHLSDDQAQTLNQIASQCVLEMKAIDERAKLIVAIYKAQYPNGQVPHGQLPAAPPAVLREMTSERNALVLRKRDELRAAFGEERFNQFQVFVRNRIAPNVNPVSAGQ